MEEIRLQKFMAECGVASRRKCEEYIINGQVKVNGNVTTELGTKINPLNDIVEFNYNPKESISINNVVKTFTVPMGMSILSIHVVVYNYETDSFKDCYTIEDVLNKNYYFRIFLGDQVVFNAKIIDTLNNLYVMDYTTTFYNTDQELLTMRVESNMISLSFLAGVDSICMLFQNVSSPESENA